MKGIVHMMVPLEQFELLRGADAITTYRSAPTWRSTRSAGIAASTRSIRRGRMPDGVSVNVRCLEGVDIAGLRPSLFDGLHWEEFMAARRTAGES